jgi:membrane protease YdiL (CAAX protease family)
MWTIAPYLFPMGITIAANLGIQRRGWRLLAYVLLILLNALVWMGGVLLVAVPIISQVRSAAPGAALPATLFTWLGLSLAASALIGWALLLKPVRVGLSRFLRVDPESPVHTTALMFAVHLLGASVAVLPAAQSLLSRVSLNSIGPDFLVLGQAAFVAFALAGVGLGIRRDGRQTLRRLGLHRPSTRQLKTALWMILGLLAFDLVVSKMWQHLWPINFEVVMQASDQLFASFSSPYGALLLGLSAGIGEETLFRGALQPRLRIPLTSALFALGHVQYGLSPAIVEIMVVGLALGWLRERSNTTTCVVVHSGYNFLNMLLMPFWT